MRIHTEISKDGKKAFLTVNVEIEEEIVNISPEELQYALTESGVVKGINSKVLLQICNDRIYNRKYQVAEAIPPETGENAKIRIEIKKVIHEPVENDSDPNAKVDHYGVREGFITFVKEGEVLATRFPPTRGKHGYTVSGDKINGLLGSDISLEVVQGNFTAITGEKLVARVDGIFKRRDNKLHVEQVIEINGDLGMKTGSIILPLESDIELIVHGDIQSGFTVQCNKVTVSGTVEDAKITAQYLDIKSGIVGTSDLLIHADFLTTGFIIGKRDIKSRIITIKKEISGGSTVEADFVRSHIIQECTITAKYGVWTKYLYGKNTILVGVNIVENEEFNRLTLQLEGIEILQKETKLSNHSLLKKKDSIREMAKRMPNNPSVAKEVAKLNETLEKLKKLEKLRDSHSDRLNEISKKMYIFGNPFILVEHGFTKKVRDNGQQKPVNDLIIKESSYDKSKPLITGLYTVEGDNVVVNSKYSIHEIKEVIENYKKKRLEFQE